MFILDSLFMSGFRWVLDTVKTAADTEMNDDTALREQLLAAELRREMGEISDREFADLEADILERIREIKQRREGGSGAIALGGPMEATPDTRFQVEATVSGDFHEPVRDAESGTVIEGTLLDSAAVKQRTPQTRRTRGSARTGTSRTSRTSRTTRKIRTS